MPLGIFNSTWNKQCAQQQALVKHSWSTAPNCFLHRRDVNRCNFLARFELFFVNVRSNNILDFMAIYNSQDNISGILQCLWTSVLPIEISLFAMLNQVDIWKLDLILRFLSVEVNTIQLSGSCPGFYCCTVLGMEAHVLLFRGRHSSRMGYIS